MQTIDKYRSPFASGLQVVSPGLVTPERSDDLQRLQFLTGIGGAEGNGSRARRLRGRNANGDIVTSTVDGVDLGQMWAEFQATLGMWNEARDAVVRLLTFPVTVASERIYQAGTVADFEDATEYGVPQSYRAEGTSRAFGYTFRWKDLAFRYTWLYLAEATSDQLAQDNNMALEADNREIYLQVMETFFGNTRRTNKEGVPVLPFYNGDTIDEFDTPATYKNTNFAQGHNHFLTTGSSTFDQADAEALEDTITEHGHTRARGATLLLLVRKAQADQMRHWRSQSNGGQGRYDFIPSVAQPAYLLPTDPRIAPGAGDSRPAGTYQGFDVAGQYGEFLVIVEDFVPEGYVAAFATGGQDALPNPIAFREHANAGLRGLRLVKGRNPDYPLMDAYYNRGFGTGVRHRGAAAIMQITTSSTYTVPSFR